jgi:hypothetical protein
VPHVIFIVMALGTAMNLCLWKALPDNTFRQYQPAGDDTPGTKQRWCIILYRIQSRLHPRRSTIDADHWQLQQYEIGCTRPHLIGGAIQSQGLARLARHLTRFTVQEIKFAFQHIEKSGLGGFGGQTIRYG